MPSLLLRVLFLPFLIHARRLIFFSFLQWDLRSKFRAAAANLQVPLVCYVTGTRLVTPLLTLKARLCLAPLAFYILKIACLRDTFECHFTVSF